MLLSDCVRFDKGLTAKSSQTYCREPSKRLSVRQVGVPSCVTTTRRPVCLSGGCARTHAVPDCSRVGPSLLTYELAIGVRVNMRTIRVNNMESEINKVAKYGSASCSILSRENSRHTIGFRQAGPVGLFFDQKSMLCKEQVFTRVFWQIGSTFSFST